MKKVSFGAKKTAGNANNQVDAWVESREVVQQAPAPKEQMKRLTIDVPIPLHKRIKSQCALQSLIMADEIRALLEQRWPAPPNTERAAAPQNEHQS